MYSFIKVIAVSLLMMACCKGCRFYEKIPHEGHRLDLIKQGRTWWTMGSMAETTGTLDPQAFIWIYLALTDNIRQLIVSREFVFLLWWQWRRTLLVYGHFLTKSCQKVSFEHCRASPYKHHAIIQKQFRYWLSFKITWYPSRSGSFWNCHDDVIKWKHFPCYWSFVRGIHG